MDYDGRQPQDAEPTASDMSDAHLERLGFDVLPPRDTVRWVARRKAQVVTAVRRGILTLDEACARYSLSVEEFCSWQRSFDRDGIRGLRVRARSAD